MILSAIISKSDCGRAPTLKCVCVSFRRRLEILISPRVFDQFDSLNVSDTFAFIQSLVDGRQNGEGDVFYYQLLLNLRYCCRLLKV